ncbi:MAG TPA: FliI/YscN family ATPase [Paenalcaligenes sp.]|nr:FliI/YscN family ATPase [Paenalcaligenes sp.]
MNLETGFLSRSLRILELAQQRVNQTPRLQREGRIIRATGLVLEAVGLNLPIGAACQIFTPHATHPWSDAEVVGFAKGITYLMPLQPLSNIEPGAAIRPLSVRTESLQDGIKKNIPFNTDSTPARALPIGKQLLGRVLDGTGQPLDSNGPLNGPVAALNNTPINPLQRPPIKEVLDVGVRAINGLLTVGRGQRMGLFAGSGVGKSVLLGMMARFTQADVVVVGLIGERGREVREFIDQNLGTEGLQRSVVIAAPADVSPLLRLQAASYATRIAEHFRDTGHHVLLIMDSLTRYAMAQREIALALGEPPATKGYPPSVFNRLPALVERAGNSHAHSRDGSLTAFYTVLTEGDDQQDPIADAARAILDGHVVLSRQLADSGHYPAISIEGSVSRVLAQIVPTEQRNLVQHFKRDAYLYQRNHDLITVGAYVPGQDPATDTAIQRYPQLQQYLQQDMYEAVDYARAIAELNHIFARPAGA